MKLQIRAVSLLLVSSGVASAHVARHDGGPDYGPGHGGFGGPGGPGGVHGPFGDDCLRSCLSSAWPTLTTGVWSNWCNLATATPAPVSSCLSASCTGATHTFDDSIATSFCSAYSSCSTLSLYSASSTTFDHFPTGCAYYGDNNWGPGWHGGHGGNDGWGPRGPDGWWTVTEDGVSHGWTTKTDTITTTSTGSAGEVTAVLTEVKTGTIVAVAVAEVATTGTAILSAATNGAGPRAGRHDVASLGGLLGIALGAVVLM